MPSRLIQIARSVENPATPRSPEEWKKLRRGKICGFTGKGAHRPGNEDAFLIAHDYRTGFVAAWVADGMGGHQKGAEASCVTLASIQWQILHMRSKTLPQRNPLPHWFSVTTEQVLALAQGLTTGTPGSTLVGFIGNLRTGEFYMGQSGDSRLFHLNSNGDITLYHPDNAMPAEFFFKMWPRIQFPLVDKATSAYSILRNYYDLCRGDPSNCVITSRMGDPKSDLLARGLRGAHFSTIRAKPGDRLFCFTDGMEEAWTASEFFDILRHGLGNPIERTIEKLSQANLISTDNNTVVGVEV